MPEKNSILQIVKSKKDFISRALLLPAFLVVAQLVAFGVSSLPHTKAESQPDTAGAAQAGTPQVLGATIDVRGQQSEKRVPVTLGFPEETLEKISAGSYLVYDQDSGTVLLSRNPGERVAIASLTKLMTGLLAYQHLDFNQTITVDTRGLTSVRPVVGFIDGDEARIGDIFDAMIVGSCNDAAQVLARAVAAKTGKDITVLMNEKARELGMNGSKFANPVGFDSAANYSTAEDLKKLIEETQKLAVFANLGKTTFVNFSGALNLPYRAAATNTLIKARPDIQAIKTGFTKAAQGAMATKVAMGGHGVIILVLESGNREKDTLALKELIADRVIWQ